MRCLLFPHQLFAEVLTDPTLDTVVLHRHPLFFTQYDFHPEKRRLHDESLSAFADALARVGKQVEQTEAPLTALATAWRTAGQTTLVSYECTDDWLERDFRAAFAGFVCHERPSPLFLTPKPERERYFTGKRRVSLAEFYKLQRRRLGVLVGETGEPVGGRWSFDTENRKPLPKSLSVPERASRYPRTHAEAQAQLTDFLTHCLADFGPYEDAMRTDDGRLFHSVLTPALNIGLLTPQQVLEQTLAFAESHPTPLPSLEGFIRQVIGWREFVHGTYEALGRRQRTTNFFGFTNPLPEAFWHGTTGLLPADTVIQRVNTTGYCHHIERLMVLGNLLLLLEVHPDAVYTWFMTQFIDAYDWVMVPNVYGMSQYADGGLMTTKPYLSGSAYLRKLGDWPGGAWTAEWDALYWRFIHRHRRLFLSNHRSAMMVHLYDKLKPETRAAHHARVRALEARLELSLPTEPLP